MSLRDASSWVQEDAPVQQVVSDSFCGKQGWFCG